MKKTIISDSQYIELYCELADIWLENIYDGDRWEYDDDGCANYTPAAQDIFNRLADNICGILAQCEIYPESDHE